MWMLQTDLSLRGQIKSGFQAGKTCPGRIERQGIEYVKIDLTKPPPPTRSEGVSPNQACFNRLNDGERRKMKKFGGCLNLEPLSRIREGKRKEWMVTVGLTSSSH